MTDAHWFTAAVYAVCVLGAFWAGYWTGRRDGARKAALSLGKTFLEAIARKD